MCKVVVITHLKPKQDKKYGAICSNWLNLSVSVGYPHDAFLDGNSVSCE